MQPARPWPSPRLGLARPGGPVLLPTRPHIACPAKRGKTAGDRPSSSSSSSSFASSLLLSSSTTSTPTKLVTVSPDASDAWRLDPVIQALREGGVGVIPTDTLPALVVDVAARDAAARLCAAKGGPPKVRALALLCRGWADVDAYTAGFPAPPPGAPDPFRVARAALPGPYTLILGAAKALPKAASLAELGRKHGGGGGGGGARRRATVGVRLTSHPVARAVLAALDRPLLCTSVRPDAVSNSTDDEDEDDDEEGGGDGSEAGGSRARRGRTRPVGWSPEEDAPTLADRLSGRGVAFVVDCGPRPPVPDVSTVLDFSKGWPPDLVRAGAGDAGVFGVEEEDEY